jgi:hypothetical protein
MRSDTPKRYGYSQQVRRGSLASHILIPAVSGVCEGKGEKLWKLLAAQGPRRKALETGH